MKTKKIHKTNKVLRSIVYAIIIVNCQLSIVNCIAQGGAAINTTGNEANVSAMLDVNSTNQGMLIPRMTTAQRVTIATPVPESLLIFNLDTKCFEFYTNGNWITLSCGCYPPSAAGNISGTATVCQGTNNVVYSVAPIANATGYTWSLPTGASIATGANTNSVTVNYAANATSGNITVYGTSNGCGNGTVSQNYAITVNTNPNASISGTTTICNGSSTTFTASTGSAYLWSQGATTAAINVSPTTNTTYTVTITNSGCTSSTSTTVTVNPNLPANVGIAAVPSGAICSGTSVTFTATPTNGGSLPTYQWKKNNVNVGSGGITYTDATLANNDAITCVMTSNASPCLTGSPATSNTLTITIFTLCNNIVAYWKFDESTGNAADAVGSNNGTPTDITYSTANGKIHNGAGFNGSSSKIVTSSNISISGNFSFACWVNVASYLNNYPLVMDLGTYGGGSGNSAFIIVGHIGVNRGVQFAYYQSGWYQATTNTQMSSGWHFIVGTVTVGGGGSAMVLYIDGNSAATGAAPSSVSINNTMSIGTDYTGVADKFYDGAIDEIGIWSRALTPAEVTSLYNNGTGLQYPF